MNHSFDIDHAKQYGIEEAIIIANFQFWIGRNKANGENFRDGRTWTYNSVKALEELFPYMSSDRIRRTLESLVKQNVLVTGVYNARPADRTKWYAFTDETGFLPHLAKTPNGPSKQGESDLAKTPNGIGVNAKSSGKNAKCVIKKDVNPDVTPDTPLAVLTSAELFEQAWVAYPKRTGASKKDTFKQWEARLKAGADPLAIIAGVKAYAAYVAAEGTQPKFIKSAETFFGPGEHYSSDWTPARSNAPVAAQGRARNFDPTAYVNSGEAYANQFPSPAAAHAGDPFTIDGQFVERPA